MMLKPETHRVAQGIGGTVVYVKEHERMRAITHGTVGVYNGIQWFAGIVKFAEEFMAHINVLRVRVKP
jgi:hypothetical protein